MRRGKRALTGWTYTHGCLTVRGCTAPRGSPAPCPAPRLFRVLPAALYSTRFTFCHHTSIVRIWGFYSKESTSSMLLPVSRLGVYIAHPRYMLPACILPSRVPPHQRPTKGHKGPTKGLLMRVVCASSAVMSHLYWRACFWGPNVF
jgi:hypothetical protein